VRARLPALHFSKPTPASMPSPKDPPPSLATPLLHPHPPPNAGHRGGHQARPAARRGGRPGGAQDAARLPAQLHLQVGVGWGIQGYVKGAFGLQRARRPSQRARAVAHGPSALLRFPRPARAPPCSAHYCRDPLLASAVGRFLEREAQQVGGGGPGQDRAQRGLVTWGLSRGPAALPPPRPTAEPALLKPCLTPPIPPHPSPPGH
jgi:hypothetical protein